MRWKWSGCLFLVVTTAMEAPNQMDCGLPDNVVVCERAVVFQLTAAVDQTLYICGHTLPIPIFDHLLHLENGGRALHIQQKIATGQHLDKQLEGTSDQSQHQPEIRVLLNVVIGQGARVFQLPGLKHQTLLSGWDGFLVLQLVLDVLHRVRGLHVQCYGLAEEVLDEDLITT